MKYLIITFLLVFLPLRVFADVKLFLYSKAIVKAEGLLLKDLARIEGKRDVIKNIYNIKINEKLYQDRYVDSNELYKILKTNLKCNLYVFGNSVHILNDKTELTKNNNKPSIVRIKKGDTVNVIIKRKGISIEVIGESLVDAKVGDSVMVDLNQNKKLRGTLKSDKIVEVVL